jgi:hypothetical protein
MMIEMTQERIAEADLASKAAPTGAPFLLSATFDDVAYYSKDGKSWIVDPRDPNVREFGSEEEICEVQKGIRGFTGIYDAAPIRAWHDAIYGTWDECQTRCLERSLTWAKAAVTAASNMADLANGQAAAAQTSVDEAQAALDAHLRSIAT